jgi:hypothetical protein
MPKLTDSTDDIGADRPGCAFSPQCVIPLQGFDPSVLTPVRAENLGTEGTFSPVSQSRRQETQALTWRVAIQGLLCLEWGCSASYAELMPWGLTRYHHTRQSNFVTFCCYHRRPLFTTDASRRVFEDALERVRRSFCLRVSGYVVMPEDIHLNVRNHGQFVPLFADP